MLGKMAQKWKEYDKLNPYYFNNSTNSPSLDGLNLWFGYLFDPTAWDRDDLSNYWVCQNSTTQ